MLRTLGLVAAVLAAAEAAGQDSEAEGRRHIIGTAPERLPIYPVQSYSVTLDDDLTFFLQIDDPLAEAEQYDAEACFITSNDRVCTETAVYEVAMIPRFFSRSVLDGEEAVEIILYAPECSTRVVLYGRSRVESTLSPGCR